ncbi:MAG TPA: 6-carboxytetrahydropterin synthase [Anaerolineaceae bacterium]|jgi:6-pyruvoyltetrahydropterin/6-carboxytetrahydropterin synthase
MGFRVIVEKSNLQFAAGHFITYGGKCELLHGHNYALSLELEGSLNPDGYVFDFVALKKIARAVTETLDHRFLLAAENPHLHLHQDASGWEIIYKEDRYVLPNRVVLPLPLDNVTAERLAEYIWGEVAREIRAHGAEGVTTLSVGVEEAPGQTAYFSQGIKTT